MLIAQSTVQGAVSQATIWLEQGIALLTEFAPKVPGVVVIFFLGRFISGKVASPRASWARGLQGVERTRSGGFEILPSRRKPGPRARGPRTRCESVNAE